MIFPLDLTPVAGRRVASAQMPNSKISEAEEDCSKGKLMLLI